MIELQALAALLAFERARERALRRATRAGRPVLAALGGIALGWIAGARGPRAS